jgi:uridine monophosphate synthetase
MHKLIQDLFQAEAVKFEDHSLTNGQVLPVYIDLRQALAFPAIYRRLTTTLIKKIAPLEFQAFCGLPYGAIPMVSLLSQMQNVPMILMRKQLKNHGTQKWIDGQFNPGDKILAIDDFISSGATMNAAIDLLKQHDLLVSDIVVFIDSQLGGTTLMESRGIKTHAVMTLVQFYQILQKSVLLTSAQQERITLLLKLYEDSNDG